MKIIMRFEQLADHHLESLTALWNKQLKTKLLMTLILMRQNTVEDRLTLQNGSVVAIDSVSGQPVSYVVTKASDSEAAQFGISDQLDWIHALLVDSEWRQQGIGTELLRRAEVSPQVSGKKQVMLGNDLHRRMFPGIPDELKPYARPS